MRQRGMAAEIRAIQRRRHGLAPFGVVEIREVHFTPHARVVHDDIQPAELSDGRLDEACDVSRIAHVEEFDNMIAAQDIQEQVPSESGEDENGARPDAGLASEVLGAPDNGLGFRSITEAQREVFALHEIAQTIGSSLNLQDTVSLVSSKLRAIVPFDTCIIYLVDEKTGKALPAHVAARTRTFSSNGASASATASPATI